MKFSAQSDSNSRRYSVFPERGGFIFLTVQLIFAIFSKMHSPKGLPWPVLFPAKPFGPKYGVSAFQHSRAKSCGTEKSSKIFKKIFFRYLGPQSGGKDPPTSKASECMCKALVWTRKMPFRTSFYLGSTLTYDVLKVMFGGVKHVNSKRYEYLSDLKAIEMQYGLLKT